MSDLPSQLKCSKCNGTGKVTHSYFYGNICFCCSGKGHRTLEDQTNCREYVKAHPKHTYYCAEIGFVDKLYIE
jgi:DnaJ-class molecular chaperone